VQFKDHDDLPKSDQRRIPQSGKEDIIAHQHRLLARDPEAQAVSPPGEFSTGTSGDYSAGTHRQDWPLLQARHAIYQAARERNPRRWSRQTRNWTPITAVTLNPERDTLIQTTVSPTQLSGSAGEPAFSSRSGNALPRRATQGKGGAEPPGATRSEVSMARMASTAPSRE
jgi:hypothetical protein